MKNLWLKIGSFFKLAWEYLPMILIVLLGIALILQVWATYHYVQLKFELMDDLLSH